MGGGQILVDGGGDVHLKLGEVGVLIEEREDFGREVVGFEGIGKVVGRGIVIDDVVPGRHGQHWMRRWIPPEFLVRRRR